MELSGAGPFGRAVTRPRAVRAATVLALAALFVGCGPAGETPRKRRATPESLAEDASAALRAGDVGRASNLWTRLERGAGREGGAALEAAKQRLRAVLDERWDVLVPRSLRTFQGRRALRAFLREVGTPEQLDAWRAAWADRVVHLRTNGVLVTMTRVDEGRIERQVTDLEAALWEAVQRRLGDAHPAWRQWPDDAGDAPSSPNRLVLETEVWWDTFSLSGTGERDVLTRAVVTGSFTIGGTTRKLRLETATHPTPDTLSARTEAGRVTGGPLVRKQEEHRAVLANELRRLVRDEPALDPSG